MALRGNIFLYYEDTRVSSAVDGRHTLARNTDIAYNSAVDGRHTLARNIDIAYNSPLRHILSTVFSV
jgi:hypothetical protein